MDLEVLVATMQQADLSLVERMNLYQNAVIANQCGQWSYAESQSESYRIRMLSSNTKGVGINRNLALQLAEADILLFADDDIVYYDSDLQPVIDAFNQLPDADVIFFAIDMTRNGEVFDRRRHGCRRLHLWNSLRYGACRMAIRREAVVKHRLSFSTLEPFTKSQAPPLRLNVPIPSMITETEEASFIFVCTLTAYLAT